MCTRARSLCPTAYLKKPSLRPRGEVNPVYHHYYAPVLSNTCHLRRRTRRSGPIGRVHSPRALERGERHESLACMSIFSTEARRERYLCGRGYIYRASCSRSLRDELGCLDGFDSRPVDMISVGSPSRLWAS